MQVIPSHRDKGCTLFFTIGKSLLLEAQLDFNFTILALSTTLPESLRLADGDHTLNLTVNTHQGEQVNYSSMFTVAAGVNTNSHGEARAFGNGAPEPAAATNLYAEPIGDTIEIRFDNSFTATTRWILERSIEEDPFERLLPEEATIRNGFLDDTAPPGSHLVYRLTPVSADGVATGAWATVSTNLPNAPTPPAGFAVINATNAVTLRWDDYADRRATELRVYRNTGDGFELCKS